MRMIIVSSPNKHSRREVREAAKEVCQQGIVVLTDNLKSDSLVVFPQEFYFKPDAIKKEITQAKARKGFSRYKKYGQAGSGFKVSR